MSTTVNPEIFREYDIRGVVGRDLTPAVAHELGRGYAVYLRQQGGRKVTLGYDARPSSVGFRDAMAAGMVESGLDVVDVGLVPTPVLYFSLFHLQVDGGVMITGSHNPPEFNGFKLGVGRSTIFGEQILEVRDIIARQAFVQGAGTLAHQDVLPAYLQTVKERVGPFARRLRVVVDAGNGTGAMTGCQLLETLGAEVIPLYCEVDGTFPNHHPDPTVPRYLQDLVRTVLETKAEVGIAYDGDADRIGVVDEVGRIIWGDQLMIIFAREILAHQPGASIVFEVKCSQSLPDEISKAGGRPVMWKTGHSLIKQKMKELNAPLAGEMSGHLFFADEYFGYDDAVYASCRLVRLLSRSQQKVGEMLANVPKTYSTPETRLECPDDLKFQVVAEVAAYFRERYKTIEVDGVRVLFGDGWGLVRASNTQPVLVVRFEAQTPERLTEISDEVLGRLAQYPFVVISTSL
jgi:phosphomannomutase / phosphoglucomutase